MTRAWPTCFCAIENLSALFISGPVALSTMYLLILISRSPDMSVEVATNQEMLIYGYLSKVIIELVPEFFLLSVSTPSLGGIAGNHPQDNRPSVDLNWHEAIRDAADLNYVVAQLFTDDDRHSISVVCYSIVVELILLLCLSP